MAGWRNGDATKDLQRCFTQYVARIVPYKHAVHDVKQFIYYRHLNIGKKIALLYTTVCNLVFFLLPVFRAHSYRILTKTEVTELVIIHVFSATQHLKVSVNLIRCL